MADGRNKGGRPSKYAPELVAEICQRLSNGEPLTKICADAHMPCDDTVRNWMDADSTVFRDIVRARAAGFDEIAHRTRSTARGKKADEGGDSTGDVQRDKLIIETDLKLLAKWDPKRYGDKLAMEHSGPEGGPIQTIDASKLSTTALQELLSVRRAEADAG